MISRKRTTTEDGKELAHPPSKEARDKFEMDRGHGVARALETVLNAQREDKAQDLSLVSSSRSTINLRLGSSISRKKDQRTITTSIIKHRPRSNHIPPPLLPQSSPHKGHRPLRRSLSRNSQCATKSQTRPRTRILGRRRLD